MATIKPAYTKRGDTEMLWLVNMSLDGATVKAFAKNEANVVTTLPATVADNSGKIAITTSSLPVGKYKLEVEVTIMGKVATFPDSGYAVLIVVEDLG